MNMIDVSYLNEEVTLPKFMKAQHIDTDLVYNYRRYFPEHKHPTIVLEQLYEVNQHNKKLVCIDSPARTSRSSCSILFLLDQFVKMAPTLTLPEDVGSYLVILASSRDQCIAKFELISQLLQGRQSVQAIDINEFFPMKHKGKLPKVSLPPATIPTVLIGTPSSFLKLVSITQLDQQGVLGVLYDECDLIRIYGGLQQLKELYEWLGQSQKSRTLHLWIGTSATVESITMRMPTVIQIESEEPEEPQPEKKEAAKFGNYFYTVAQDDTQKYIVAYITLKLNLMQGKTLIIVPDLSELYKVQLFFQRSGIENFQLYNHENPKTLKYYVLSTFNTGVITTLIATPKIFEEISTIFFDHKQKQTSSSKKEQFHFKHLDNILTIDIDPSTIEFTHHLNGFGNVLVVQDRDEEQIENLLTWINRSQQGEAPLTIKEYPLTHDEIEAFRYRVHDVIANISRHQVKQASQIDFKKKMLKSPDLTEYFKTNPKEKEILQQQIVKLKAALRKSQIVITGQIPEYLLPEVIKHQRKAEQPKRFSKILVHQYDKDAEKVKEKRRLLAQDPNNMLPKPLDEEVDERLVKKLKMNNEKFIYVDEDKEDPSVVDPSKLKTISSRKLWKIKHGFKIKKTNKRLERKGIFQA